MSANLDNCNNVLREQKAAIRDVMIEWIPLQLFDDCMKMILYIFPVLCPAVSALNVKHGKKCPAIKVVEICH
ncbi:MAG: hypothetical protein WCQ70_10845 [Lentimicrobiaceae bacterium]